MNIISRIKVLWKKSLVDIRVWLSLVERVVWDHEVGGSSPSTRTIIDTYSNSSLEDYGFKSHRTHQ